MHSHLFHPHASITHTLHRFAHTHAQLVMHSNSLSVAYTPNGAHSSASTCSTTSASLSPIEVYDTPTFTRFPSQQQQQHHLPDVPWDRLKSMPAAECSAAGAAAQLDEAELPDVPLARLHSNVGGASRTVYSVAGSQRSNAGVCIFVSLCTQPKDLDSIDRLDDPDCVDAQAVKAAGGADGGKSNGDGKQPPQDGKQKGENEGTVTFLYYALQCCDCTIS